MRTTYEISSATCGSIAMTKRVVIFAAGCLILLVSSGLEAKLFSSRKTVEELQEKINRYSKDNRSKTKAILYADLGTAHYNSSRFEDAFEAFENALKCRMGRHLKRYVYLFLAKSYESAGRWDKAVGAYEKAAWHDKRNWKRHRDLGQMYERVKLFDKAMDSYEKALLYNPKEASLYFNVGRTWRQVGFFEKAEQNLLRAKELDYDSPDLHMELSYVYEGESRFRDSLVAFQKVMGEASPPEDLARLIYLAVLSKNKEFANQGMDQLRQKNVSEATLDFYESLVELADKDLDYILSLNQTDPVIKRLLSSINWNF